MKHLVKAGTTDYSAIVKLIRSSSTTGAPLTGLTYEDVDFAYTRVETDNDVTVTACVPATLASLTAAHSDWGFIKVDDTEAPGLYRVDLADAALAAGAWSSVVTVRQAFATTCALQADLEFQLVTFDPFDTVRLGLTALPNAAADAAGGLPISDAGGLDLDMISTTVYVTRTNTDTLITTSNAIHTHAQTIETNCDAIKTNTATLITNCDAIKTNTATIITTCDAIHTHAESIETVAYITRTNTDTLITTSNAIHTHVETIDTASLAIHTHVDLIEDVLANKMVVTEADGSTTLYADDDATPLLTCTLTSTLGRTTRTKLA